jgi:hypothetical protein
MPTSSRLTALCICRTSLPIRNRLSAGLDSNFDARSRYRNRADRQYRYLAKLSTRRTGPSAALAASKRRTEGQHPATPLIGRQAGTSAQASC